MSQIKSCCILKWRLSDKHISTVDEKQCLSRTYFSSRHDTHLAEPHFSKPARTVVSCQWGKEKLFGSEFIGKMSSGVWVSLSATKRDIELFTLLVPLEAAIWRHHGRPLETQITQQLGAADSHNYTVSIIRAMLSKRHILHGAQPAERKGCMKVWR